ncbi:carbohydrate ABC transporter permease [Microterricola viridarii]|uniref:Carbohydrate ABC transporter membrane protein 1, CUT1 family n=1 Tax=Microterricola viridarii TaxID=412690 RepID=A0A1H1MFI8_9MICO|nr:sugar ABC transporter permease [Microterricola viridarii]SDR85466.1 carbohydrate ABC transporter membrane protein 1, CUT1 family [Microterricola viridarii]
MTQATTAVRLAEDIEAQPPAATAPAGPARTARRKIRLPLVIFLAPFVIFFIAFFVLPICYAIWDSLFAMQSSGLGFGAPERVFVFLENYAKALGTPSFMESIGRVILFAIIEVPLMIGGALALALLLESGKGYFPRLFRVIYFMPYGVPGVIASLLWGFLYIPTTSPVLQGLSNIGINLIPLGPDSVLFAIANIALWGFAGYNMLILIATLQSIPAELYEAARIDGANQWHIIRNIQIPLLRPTIIMVTVFTIIGTLQLFVEPLVLKPLTTAINSDFTPNLAAYNQAFSQSDPNLAAAMAVIVAIIAFVFSFGFLSAVNRKGNRAW